ncbi:hypothetical protein PIB30_085115 [Stylosanthes scabra]|uniref:Uncharacterized protein n=1 Tax=Stylosanthes scabra TaxID=79078 RepID=A0ABU6US74_9FABA|nr:hypothetical protein [Stylosanthes scabra]
MDRFKPEVATSDIDGVLFAHVLPSSAPVLIPARGGCASVLLYALPRYSALLKCSASLPLMSEALAPGCFRACRLLSRSPENVTSGLVLCSSGLSCLQRYVLFLT